VLKSGVGDWNDEIEQLKALMVSAAYDIQNNDGDMLGLDIAITAAETATERLRKHGIEAYLDEHRNAKFKNI
jgi:hypothetical protein